MWSPLCLPAAERLRRGGDFGTGDTVGLQLHALYHPSWIQLAEVITVFANSELCRVGANHKCRRRARVLWDGTACFDRGDIFQLPDGARTDSTRVQANPS